MIMFIATVRTKDGRVRYRSGEHVERDAAIAEAFAAKPKAKVVSSGYGYNGSFDIRSTRRADFKPA